MTDMITRSAALAPTSVDINARTFWAVVATEAPITRNGIGEILDTAAVDPRSLVGLPVQDDHAVDGVNSTLGRVIDARREANGDLAAQIKISAAEPAIMTKISEGIVRATSIRATVQQWRPGPTPGTRVAARWRASEISLTNRPADSACLIRSQTMDMDQVESGGAAGNEQAHTEITNRADLGKRNQVVRNIATAAGLSRDWADAEIDAGHTEDEVRRHAFDEMLKRKPARSVAAVQVIQDHNDPEIIRNAMAGALAARLDPSVKIEGASAQYAGWSLIDLGAELVRARGGRLDSRNRQRAADELLRSGAGHSTSDFPLLLENALNKSVLPRYATAASTYKDWSAPRSLNDFRPHKSLRLGDFPALQEVTAESGEVKFGTISENCEAWQAKEFSTGITITRRALVNDDLGQLQDFTALIGQRVAADENSWNYAYIASNPTLSDGSTLFHAAAHGNLAASGGAISVTTVGAGIQAVRKQKSLDGILLNLQPNILVVGPAIETSARQFLAVITPAQTANVNPWAGQFKLVVDANITGNEWYLFCDPSAAPVFVHGYVQGTGPVVRSEIDFDTRGLKVVVGLDYGYGAIDFRGAYKNAGA